MWVVVLSSLMGGAFALGGVALASYFDIKRTERTREADRREAKVERLRGAYAEIVSAAEGFRTRSQEAILLAERDTTRVPALLEKLMEPDESPRSARTALLLEQEETDRAALEAFSDAERRYARFRDGMVWWVAQEQRGEDPDLGSEARNQVNVSEAAEKVTDLARKRLAELET